MKSLIIILALSIATIALAGSSKVEKQFKSSVTHDDTNKTVYRLKVEYADLIGPMAIAMKNLDRYRLESPIYKGCKPTDTDTRVPYRRYGCEEYPFGAVQPNGTKYLWDEDKNGNLKPMVRYYKDKNNTKSLRIDIKVQREPRTAKMNELMLNREGPGFKLESFETSPKVLGDTLISIWPENNALYTNLCQYFPGTTVVHDEAVRIKYDYFKWIKFKRGKIKTYWLNVSPKLEAGGVVFDTLKFCMMMKLDPTLQTMNEDGTKGTQIVQVVAPNAPGSKLIPLDIELDGVTWVILLIIVIILAIIIAFVGGLTGGIGASLGMSIGSVLIVGFIAVIIDNKTGGDIFNNLARKGANNAIEVADGIKLEDLNNPDWIEKLAKMELDKKTSKEDSKNGKWALNAYQNMAKQNVLATLRTVRTSQIMQAGYAIDGEKYQQRCMEALEKFRPKVETLVGSIKQKTVLNEDKKNKLDASLVMIEQFQHICKSFKSASIKVTPFVKDPVSEKNGCYSKAQIALKDAVLTETANAKFLMDKVKKSTSGDPKKQEVINALEKRLEGKNLGEGKESFDLFQFDNWWAKRGTENSCKFFMDIEIKDMGKAQRNLAFCMIKNFYGETRYALAQQNLLADSLLDRCEIEIRSLIEANQK